MNPISTTAPVQASVSVTDNGSVITPSTVLWGSVNPDIATVDPVTGVVTPVAPGSAQINVQVTGTIVNGTVSQSYSLTANGLVNVTALGDNLVATVDFTPIA